MTYTSAFDDGSIRVDASLVSSHVSEAQIEAAQQDVEKAAATLHSLSGPGHEFLGWLDPTSAINDDELYRLRKVAARLRDETDCLVIVGIGGSYLGTRACYEALRKPDSPYVLRYAGTNLSPHYHADLLASLDNIDFAINVVSKSGTTTEPAIAFRLLREELIKRSSPGQARERIVATTDRQKGALRQLADSEEWESFIVPDDIGGRFSALTPVGLFPLAYAGIDIDALVGGATECAVACRDARLSRNPARLYATVRHLLWKSGLSIEMLVAFEPRFEQLIEWWKQLYGESLGKGRTGVFPSGAIYTRDLHSMGQWVQDGARTLFETFLEIEGKEPSLKIPKMDSDDELDYLEGRELADINRIAAQATRKAHFDGGCPNLGLSVSYIDEYHLGVLIYFFEYACAVAGYMAGVNPFDQPGVEVYKKNMFKLLGKP